MTATNFAESTPEERWQEIANDEQVSTKELNAAKELYRLIQSQSMPLAQAFKQMDHNQITIVYPQSLKWRAAYILVKYQLLQPLTNLS